MRSRRRRLGCRFNPRRTGARSFARFTSKANPGEFAYDGNNRYRASLHHAFGRRSPRRAAVVARGRGGQAGAGHPRIYTLSQARRHAGARRADAWLVRAGKAMLRSASTCVARASPTGSWTTNISQRELEDACEVIAWLGRQPWCDGRVGMMGKSWGGFNALQTAALRPPALKAIITVCSTDDRYADDVHYMGGALLNDNLWWGTIMLAYQARPPDPALVGEGWRSQWLERLRGLPFFPALWLAHQRRDAYWRHGSVCEDFSAIACPVFAVGGWADAYTNAVPRLARGPQRAAARADRPMGACLSARRHAGPGNRLPARGAALVGPLAERRGSRHHGRAHAARLHRGMVAARRSQSGAGSLRRRSALAIAANRRAGRFISMARALAKRPSPAKRRDSLAVLDRPGRRRMDGHGRHRRGADRPAP